MYMFSGAFWLIIFAVACIDLYISYLFSKIPSEKGYEEGGKWIVIAFFGSIAGKLYIMALPDKTLRSLLKSGVENKRDSVGEDFASDELPDL